MADSVDKRFPALAAWVIQQGYVELGDRGNGKLPIRVLDDRGNTLSTWYGSVRL